MIERHLLSEPSVSVVMVVYYPHPVFFRQAVQSILNQSWRDFELLIVEDPSPSHAEELLHGLRDSRVRHLLNTERTSLVEQRNTGVSLATGRYIAFMDADDVAYPSRLAKQIEYLDASRDTVVLGSQISVIDAQDQVVGYRRFPQAHDNILRALPRVVPLSQPSVMLRRGAFAEYGGYQSSEYSACEDYELWSRWIQQGARFANHPEPLLFYRLHPNQTKFTKLRETILADLWVKENYWADGLELRSRLWRRAERLLLHLPEWLVARLLISILYHAGKEDAKAVAQRLERTAPPAARPPRCAVPRLRRFGHRCRDLLID